MNATRSTEDRLADCFASVFPDVPREQLTAATPETIEAWDSIALATLIAAVEEEFNVVLPSDYTQLTSFQAFLPLVEDPR